MTTVLKNPIIRNIKKKTEKDIDETNFECDCDHYDFLPIQCIYCKNVKLCEECMPKHFIICPSKKNSQCTLKNNLLKECVECDIKTVFSIKCDICMKNTCIKCRHDHKKIHENKKLPKK